MLVAYLGIKLLDGLLAQPIATVGQEHHNGLQQPDLLPSIIHLYHNLTAYSPQTIEDEVVGLMIRLPSVQDYAVKFLD